MLKLMLLMLLMQHRVWLLGVCLKANGTTSYVLRARLSSTFELTQNQVSQMFHGQPFVCACVLNAQCAKALFKAYKQSFKLDCQTFINLRIEKLLLLFYLSRWCCQNVLFAVEFFLYFQRVLKVCF